MKTRVLFLLASAAVAAACAKVDPMESESPAISGEYTFTAAVEKQLTKTELNDAATGLLWVAGDKVKIYGSTGNADYTAASSGAYTKLNGDSVGSAPYAAYYPADGVSSWDASAKSFTVNFPATQTYVENDIAVKSYPMISYIDSGTSFGFKNVGGLVCVKVKAAYDNIKVQSIKITAATPISGDATVAWNEGTPSVTMTGTADADKVITLDCSVANGNTGVAISSSAYTPFYIAIPSGDYEGLQVTVTGSIQDKTYTASQTLTNKGTVEVLRSSKTSFQITAANIVFDLSQQAGHLNETANTYLIKEPGKYKFPVTVKGNGVPAPDSGIESATISTSEIKSSGIYYTDGTNPVNGEITVADGYATFATPNTETLAAGNALFGVFSSSTGTAADNVKGNCIWSWDIWANPTVEDVSTTKGTTTYTFLSCHLGAHQNGFNESTTVGLGFYYQWGRKDPFMQNSDLKEPFCSSESTGGTLTDAINNPTKWYCYGAGTAFSYDWCTTSYLNLWDTDNDNEGTDTVNKTMFDPCPVGYHVPSGKAMSDIIAGGKNSPYSAGTYTHNYGFEGSLTIIWPAVGYRAYKNGIIKYGRGGSDGVDGYYYGWSALSNTGDNDQYAVEMYGKFFFKFFGKYMGYPVRPQKN